MMMSSRDILLYSNYSYYLSKETEIDEFKEKFLYYHMFKKILS